MVGNGHHTVLRPPAVVKNYRTSSRWSLATACSSHMLVFSTLLFLELRWTAGERMWLSSPCSLTGQHAVPQWKNSFAILRLASVVSEHTRYYEGLFADEDVMIITGNFDRKTGKIQEGDHLLGPWAVRLA